MLNKKTIVAAAFGLLLELKQQDLLRIPDTNVAAAFGLLLELKLKEQTAKSEGSSVAAAFGLLLELKRQNIYLSGV